MSGYQMGAPTGTWWATQRGRRLSGTCWVTRVSAEALAPRRRRRLNVAGRRAPLLEAQRPEALSQLRARSAARIPSAHRRQAVEGRMASKNAASEQAVEQAVDKNLLGRQRQQVALLALLERRRLEPLVPVVVALAGVCARATPGPVRARRRRTRRGLHAGGEVVSEEVSATPPQNWFPGFSLRRRLKLLVLMGPVTRGQT